MRLLVTGGGGQLGAYLLRELSKQGVAPTTWSGTRTVDLTRADAVAEAFRAARPDVIVHCAAVSSVAISYRTPALAEAVNVGGTRVLGELADASRARLILVSTDLVFDGERGSYVEEDTPAPLSVYGRSKLLAEEPVRALARGLVVRVSLLFGPTLIGRPSFFDEQLAALREGRSCTVFSDEWRTPLSLWTAARALAALARSDCTGVLHLGGPERLSRLEMGRRLAAFLGADASVTVPARREDVPAPEPRPRDVSLNSSRWRGHFPHLPWPTWEDALREMALP
jgi:dTDP-4-dehydrorhamnose reductase